jgi:hypothetical protein
MLGAHACSLGTLVAAWKLALAPLGPVRDAEAALNDAVGASDNSTSALGRLLFGRGNEKDWFGRRIAASGYSVRVRVEGLPGKEVHIGWKRHRIGLVVIRFDCYLSFFFAK